MSNITDSDINMTNGTFIFILVPDAQKYQEKLTNYSPESLVKPDLAYGNKVLTNYAFEKVILSIPDLEEDGDNFDAWLAEIEQLKMIIAW